MLSTYAQAADASLVITGYCIDYLAATVVTVC